MATNKNITMRQFNGTDYDTLYPKTLGSQIASTVPVSAGGTGINVNPNIHVNLGAENTSNVFEAYPRPGVYGTLPVSHGGTGQTSLAALATAMGAAKIQTGSYVGTGTYGASNPNSLTFDMRPRILWIWTTVSDESSYNAYGGVLGEDGTFAITINSNNRVSNLTFEVTVINNSISWYTTYSYGNQYWQFNQNGRQYLYSVFLYNG